MNLAKFAINFTVKGLGASRSLYEKLGFEVVHDQSEHNWLIMKNRLCVFGLRKGMIDQHH